MESASSADLFDGRSIPAPRWHAALIFVAPLLLIVGCWDAPFSAYDDPIHINPTPDLDWFLAMKASYALDRLLFESWMPR